MSETQQHPQGVFNADGTPYRKPQEITSCAACESKNIRRMFGGRVLCLRCGHEMEG